MAVGYLIGKPIGISLFTNPFSRRNPALVLSIIQFFSAFIFGFSIFIFDENPTCQAIGFGVSGIFSSCIYGGFLSVLEGRDEFNLYVAFLNLSFVFGGGLWKSIAASLLSTGVEPRLMPAITAIVGLPISVICIYLMKLAPRQSAKEIEERGERRSMSSKEMLAFVKTFFPGLLLTLIGYMIATAMRTYRDIYAVQLYEERRTIGSSRLLVSDLNIVRNGSSPPSTTKSSEYLFGDLPGAFILFLALFSVGYLKSWVSNPRKTLFLLLLEQGFGVVVILAFDLLFLASAISAFLWVMGIGMGIFLTYGVMGASFYEQIFAATRQQGTVTFLVFTSDGCGYIAVISLLFYKVFLGKGESPQLFFQTFLLIMSTVLLVVLILTFLYFRSVLPVLNEENKMLVKASVDVKSKTNATLAPVSSHSSLSSLGSKGKTIGGSAVIDVAYSPLHSGGTYGAFSETDDGTTTEEQRLSP
eukprot:g3895.t1